MWFIQETKEKLEKSVLQCEAYGFYYRPQILWFDFCLQHCIKELLLIFSLSQINVQPANVCFKYLRFEILEFMTKYVNTNELAACFDCALSIAT